MARCVVCPLSSSVVVVDRNGCIVAKRCEIGSRLLLTTNRKLHYWLSNDMKIIDFE